MVGVGATRVRWRASATKLLTPNDRDAGRDLSAIALRSMLPAPSAVSTCSHQTLRAKFAMANVFIHAGRRILISSRIRNTLKDLHTISILLG